MMSEAVSVIKRLQQDLLSLTADLLPFPRRDGLHPFRWKDATRAVSEARGSNEAVPCRDPHSARRSGFPGRSEAGDHSTYLPALRAAAIVIHDRSYAIVYLPEVAMLELYLALTQAVALALALCDACADPAFNSPYKPSSSDAAEVSLRGAAPIVSSRRP